MIWKSALFLVFILAFSFANTTEEANPPANDVNQDDQFEYQIEDNRSKLTDQDYEKAEKETYDYEEEDFGDIDAVYDSEDNNTNYDHVSDIVEDAKSYYDVADNWNSSEWGSETKAIEKKAVNDVKDDLNTLLDLYDDLDKENSKNISKTVSNEIKNISDEVSDTNILNRSSDIVLELNTVTQATTTTQAVDNSTVDNEENNNNANEEETEVHAVENLNYDDDFEEDDEDKEYTTEELNALMEQFAEDHKTELNIESESFDRNISPFYLTVDNDEMLEIRSPNYPNSYSGYNIIDYVIDGVGSGMQVDILDLNLRGRSGDYLLIKPGGLDDTTHDSSVFSYTRARNWSWSNTFEGVNKIFIRFESRGGNSGRRRRSTGFRLTVQTIIKSTTPEFKTEAPSTSTMKNEEQQNDGETFTLHVFGVGQDDFQGISEYFKDMLDNMAGLYVKKNNIYAVEDSLSDFTNIETVTSCSESDVNCTKVIFSIPLPTDDDSLTEDEMVDMWRTYSDQEEFTRQMDSLGVVARMSYEDENSIITYMTYFAISVLVIALAVMMAVITFRWMTRKNYTKMSAFLDAENISNDIGYDIINSEKKCGDVIYEKEITKGSLEEYTNNALDHDLPPPYSADDKK